MSFMLKMRCELSLFGRVTTHIGIGLLDIVPSGFCVGAVICLTCDIVKLRFSSSSFNVAGSTVDGSRLTTICICLVSLGS